MKFHLIISLFFVLLTNDGFSQNIFNRHYDTEDGLPSNEVYDVIEDNEGFLWFATDLGVSKYNGYEFTNYSFDSTALDNAILKLYKAPDGKIWFISLNGLLAYYDYKKIVPFERNDELGEALCDMTIYASFNISKNGTIYYGIRDCGMLIIKNNEKIITKSFEPNSSKFYRFVNEKAHFLTYYTRKKDLILKNRYEVQFRLNDSQIVDFKGRQMYSTYFNAIQVGKQKWYCSYFNSLFILDKGKVNLIDTLPSEIITLYLDNNQNLWAGLNNHKGIFLHDGKHNWKSTSFLNNNTVSGITQDFQGGIWASTTNNGVFYSNEHLSFLRDYSKKHTPVDFQLIGNDLYVLYANGVIYKISNNNLSFYCQINSEYSLYWLTAIGADLYAGTIGKKDLFKIQDSIPSNIKFSFPTHQPVLKKEGDTVYFYKYKQGLYKMLEEESEALKINQNGYRVECVLKDKDTYYYGKADGLLKYEDNKMTDISEKYSLTNVRVISIQKDRYNNLIIGTKNKGIKIIKNDTTINIGEKQGLSSNYVTSILVESDTIWCSTKYGLNKIFFSNKSLINLNITNTNSTDGLISNNIIKTIPHKNSIWALTSKGIIKIKRNYFSSKEKEIILKLDDIQINNVAYKIQGNYIVLPHDSNEISISYVGLDYPSSKEIEYLYKIKGLTDKWSTTTNLQIRLQSVPPGKYQIIIYAKNKNRVSNTISFNVVIAPPWWNTWWSYTGAFLFLLLIFYIIYKIRSRILIKKIKLVEKHKRDMIHLQLKALRAQMNPHFMFNSLNSILYYILEHDIDSAAKYLSKFSKLIRLILQNSEQGNIELKTEIETLNLYLDLEQSRLDNKFHFSISCENKIDNIKIPTLLIQPIVENAIWHGIMNKKGTGFICITLKKEKNSIICTIEDNGIGRKASAQIKNPKEFKKSFGLNISKERLNLLHNKFRDDIFVKVTDLQKDGIASGTKVTLIIPIN